jgi:hypothetical protein
MATYNLAGVTTGNQSLWVRMKGDGSINLTDFFILRTNFGKAGMTRARGDLSGDGTAKTSRFLYTAAEFWDVEWQR